MIEVSNLWVKIKTAGSDQAGELLHTQTSARHEAATDVLVAHTNAPLDARNVDVVAGTEVVDVTNLSARLECLDSVLEVSQPPPSTQTRSTPLPPVSSMTCSQIGPSL